MTAMGYSPFSGSSDKTNEPDITYTPPHDRSEKRSCAPTLLNPPIALTYVSD